MVRLMSYLCDASPGKRGEKIEYSERDQNLHIKEKSFLHDASYGHRGWLKKLKLAVEEGVAVGSAVEDNFSKADDSSVTPSATVSADLAPTLMATKNKNYSKDFQPRIGGRSERKGRRKKRREKKKEEEREMGFFGRINEFLALAKYLNP